MSKPYIHTEEVHNFKAPKEVVPIILDLFKPKSVLDIGCGTGTWLKIFEEYGVRDYLGVDGDYVDQNSLKIALKNFKSHNLNQELNLGVKYDLVLSLEVAEHLSDSSADIFIKSLINHSDTILFSAAVPGQGGQNHLNEQWPAYWQKKFARYGFYFHDIIRPLIWYNDKVDWWYRQNIFVVNKQVSDVEILNCYHPECFDKNLSNYQIEYDKLVGGNLGVWDSFKISLKAIKRAFHI